MRNHQYCYAAAFGASESNIFRESASSGVEHNAPDRSYDVPTRTKPSVAMQLLADKPNSSLKLPSIRFLSSRSGKTHNSGGPQWGKSGIAL